MIDWTEVIGRLAEAIVVLVIAYYAYKEGCKKVIKNGKNKKMLKEN